MKYVECPNEYKGKEKSIFLAGGISNCPDWQSYMASLLKNEELVILNPRRAYYPEDDKMAVMDEQINWEFRHLDKSDGILFWFPSETVCPITLYELGSRSRTPKKLFVGLHTDYSRKLDVEIQTRLIRPEIEIVYSMENLSEQVKNWARST